MTLYPNSTLELTEASFNHSQYLHEGQHPCQILVFCPYRPPLMLIQTLLLGGIQDANERTLVRTPRCQDVHEPHRMRTSGLGEMTFVAVDGQLACPLLTLVAGEVWSGVGPPKWHL